MFRRYLLSLLIACALCVLCLSAAAGRAAWADAPARHWTPDVPPRAHYTIEVRVDPGAGRLEGTETIRFKNDSQSPISRLALDWALDDGRTLQVAMGGQPVPLLGVSEEANRSAPLLLDLPQALESGEQVTLSLRFGDALPEPEREGMFVLTGWHPRLWWGMATHDDFEVRVQAPPSCAVATSGRLDEAAGSYRATGVRSFGVFLGQGLQAVEAYAGDVLVRSIFTEQGADCARLLLETAVDAIGFYREWLGFYPYPILTILPGMERPVGGCPVATNMVMVHGQERMSGRSEGHWRWITAHEIGHQYWGEYVMDGDDPAWLWIGLGIYADRAYIRARGLGPELHQRFIDRYVGGVRKGFDTTIDRPPEQLESVNSNEYNNVVIHGKGYSVVSALACLLGEETFDRIYRHCLQAYAGRQLGAHEFQALCEEESGQDLGWFFQQWVRSDRYLSYQITSQECAEVDGRYRSQVRVECLGTLRMPVPVVASFEDGTSQRQFTERLLDVDVLQFESEAPLREARLDPEGELALVVPPPSSGKTRVLVLLAAGLGGLAALSLLGWRLWWRRRGGEGEKGKRAKGEKGKGA